MKIILDNGHGADTAGKRSPDGRLREYAWARDVVRRIADRLTAYHHNVHILVPEEDDIKLAVRTRRVNDICRQYGTANCLLVSVHINAAGNGTAWTRASGWCGFVAPNASERSKLLAQLLYKAAARRGLQGNRAVPACQYWTGNFAIIRDTLCPAVLTENLFMDNEAEVEYLLSEEGRNAIADLHVEAIRQYISLINEKD